MRAKVIKKLEIDRAKWGRGETGGRLIAWGRAPHAGMMCCLGFLGKKCGVKGMRNKELPSEAPGPWPTWAGGTKILDMVEVNDDCSISDRDREKQLKKLFAEVGVELTFVGE